MERLRVIDSHTGGEPTRVVIDGLPDLGAGTVAERFRRFIHDFDRYRTAIIDEPRSSGVPVGALLLEPSDPTCQFGVAFFNDAGYLDMCGHGTIGLIATLAHLGRIEPGAYSIETPVGPIEATLHPDGRASFDNVPAYRHATSIEVELPGHGQVTGDLAYGGNWFFISSDHGQILEPTQIEGLLAFTQAVRAALKNQGSTGANGREIDHVELVGPTPTADSRNFVLCPGRAYDRSPCGTGTSAKLACLFEDGILREGQTWRQESIIGSVFEGTIRRTEAGLIPTISGRAFVNGETTIIIDPADPFAWGIP